MIKNNLKMILQGALQVNKPIIANDLIYVYSGITSDKVIPIYRGISVNGSIDVTNNISATGNISAGGNITAVAFYENSDKSLKQNIIDILDTDLYKISNIKFKEFEFKNESIKKYGVIACKKQD